MPGKRVALDAEELRDPVEFTKRVLRYPDGSQCVPHETQEAVMRGIRPRTAIVTGRQWGKSTCMAWLVVWFAVMHPHRVVMIAAPSLEQARIIFDEVAGYFNRAPLSALLAKKPKDSPFPEIELLNGTTVMGRGTNSPKYIRGNRVHLFVLDEGSFVDDDTINKVIEPMFTVTGKQEDSAFIMVSTPFGNGAFQDTFDLGQQDGQTRYKSHHFSSLDNPHADKEALYAIRDRYGENSQLWQTEYLGNFADADNSVFSTADIKWAYDNFPTKDGLALFPTGPEAGQRYVQGVDLANRSDYFVASLLRATDPFNVVLAKMDRLQKRGYGFYKDLIRSNYRSYFGAPTLIDSTTLGESVLEDLADISAEGYAFTGSQAKYDLVQELVRMLSEHRLRLPYDRNIISELQYFQYKITPSKVLRMEAKSGFHDDIVMSLALASKLAARPRALAFFQPVSTTVGHAPPPKPGTDPFAESIAFED